VAIAPIGAMSRTIRCSSAANAHQYRTARFSQRHERCSESRALLRKVLFIHFVVLNRHDIV